VVLCTALPTRDELAALCRVAEPVVLTTAAQLPYLRSIASLVPLPLPGAVDRARDYTATLRERIAQVVTTRGVDAELALLDPLFERFDPAEVAGGLLALLRDARPEPGEAVAAPPTEPARVKVFVNVGKKDRAAAKDLVGALIREAGVAKGDIGRVDVRETFSLVEVAAATAERAVRGLAGATIRGRRVLARLDRER
jgi:ATP-dependent RNA helicase DeaD